MFQDQRYPEKAGQFDKGIISKQGIFFHTSSDFAKQHLFCPSWGGEIFCDAPYEVNRYKEHQFLDYYLLFRILKGNLHFNYEDSKFIAFPGDIVYLDSHIANHYWASCKVRFQFFHFNGPLSRAYYELLHAQHGVCFSGRPESAFLFNNILKEMSSPNPNDQKLSLWAYTLIAGLALSNANEMNEDVLRAQQYICDNFHKPITVDDIANHVGLSRFHFSRIFKNETGFSPHQYLINTRLKHAQKLLSQDFGSLNAIAIACGFSSASHFIALFKKEFGVTPLVFKKFFDISGFS